MKKVCIVDANTSKWDYKVCIVSHSERQKNQNIISGGTLVKHDSQIGVIKVCLVNYPDNADIKITEENFPK